MAFRRSHGLPESAQVWIYPGDIELGGGAEVSLDALAAHQTSDVVLVMACRDKTPQAQAVRVRLKAKARRLGVSERVRWYGETTGIHELLACSDFVLLPNRTPYAKMDYPLVALEAMSLERPVLVGGRTPASELAEDGGAVAVEADGEAVSQAVDVLSGDDTEREALQARARALVIDSFDPRTVASQYERLYDDL